MFRALVISLFLISTSFAAELKILTTNFENLFDAEHDKGKLDFTYLPLKVKQSMPEAMAYCDSQTGFFREECLTLDWTQEVVDRKVNRIVQVLKGTMAPSLPDIITIEEVENLNVLTMVAKKLGPLYRAILIEGPDNRGVDTAMITNLPVVSSKLHEIKTGTNYPTRGILEVRLTSGKKKIAVFVNHWPSQSNPDEDRMNAGQLLVKIATEAQKSADLVIASGDFNTAADDAQNALETFITPLFHDVESEAVKQGVKLAAPATYSFRGEWASLDHIYIMKKKDGKVPDLSKTIIYTEQGKLIQNYEFQGKPESKPLRYDHVKGTGYSDHLPLGVTLSI